MLLTGWSTNGWVLIQVNGLLVLVLPALGKSDVFAKSLTRHSGRFKGSPSFTTSEPLVDIQKNTWFTSWWFQPI